MSFKCEEKQVSLTSFNLSLKLTKMLLVVSNVSFYYYFFSPIINPINQLIYLQSLGLLVTFMILALFAVIGENCVIRKHVAARRLLLLLIILS